MTSELVKNTLIERLSDRELAVNRTFNGPARIVWEAWTNAELFRRWWVPKSLGLVLLSCELDVRVGGTYRLVFKAGDGEMAFFGKYLEVIPHSRIVWTNEEGGPDQASTTTVTFEESGGKTRVKYSEVHCSKEAADEACATSAHGTVEALEQLDALMAENATGAT